MKENKIREQILLGLALTSSRLIEYKKKHNHILVVSDKNGHIKKITFN